MKKWLFISIITVLSIVSVVLGIAFITKSSELVEANASIVNLEIETSALNNEVVSLQSTKTLLESRIETTNATLAQTQTELNSTIQRLSSAETKITSLESNLSTVQNNYQSTSRELSELKSFYDGIFKGKPPPYLKPNGQVMKIVDNPVSKDPTWQQLVAFLANDLTDRREYVLGKYVCSNYSEDVHNNAEANGIRSAIVGLDFENSSVGHALNAFNTVDRGLVFIDCTGVSRFSNKSWDRVAFFMIGEQYGCINIDQPILSFEYNYYKSKYAELQSRVKQYDVNVAAHNAQVGSYNAAVQGFNAEVSQYQKAVEAYNLNPTHSEYLRLTAWYASLKSQESNLASWSNSLNSQAAALNQELYELGLQYDSYGGVLGIVKAVKMYW